MLEREYGLLGAELLPGIISVAGKHADELLPIIDNPPIWSFGTFVLAGVVGAEDTISLIETLISREIDRQQWSGKSYWLHADADISPTIKKGILSSDKLSLINNPTDYQITIRLISTTDKIWVFIWKSISVKKRFSYRKKDLWASINPVLASCIVRLIPKCTGTAIDPTCGSGTLLAERLSYSNETQGIGIDISPTAQRVFGENTSSIDGKSKDFSFRLGDSENPSLWTLCDSVFCNLPFGIKLKSSPDYLKTLYKNILGNALNSVSLTGRIVLVSSYKWGLDYAAAQHPSSHILARYRASMWGLFYQILIIKRLR